MLKGMQELGVTADVDTFHNYILPVFSSMDAAQRALQVGVCVWGGRVGVGWGGCVCVCVLERAEVILTTDHLFFQDAGVSLESEGFVSSMVRKMAVTDLAELYNRCKCTCTQSYTFQTALLYLEQHKNCFFA